LSLPIAAITAKYDFGGIFEKPQPKPELLNFNHHIISVRISFIRILA
jgi:hypothetical protein